MKQCSDDVAYERGYRDGYDRGQAEAEAKIKQLRASIETAWAIIANAHGGDWTQAAVEWVNIAKQWRDQIRNDLTE